MKDKRKEIIELAEEIVTDFELKKIPYQNIFYKCLRLCRLMNDENGILLFKYETSGYPRIDENTVTDDSWRISKLAGRHYFTTNNGEKREYMKSELVGELEKINEATKLYLEASKDPDVSISSSNPQQYVLPPQGNKQARLSAYQRIKSNEALIIAIVGHLYDYVLNIRNSVVYGCFVESTFSKYKKDTDIILARKCPEAIKRLNSAYENIESENVQNWNNSIHACRRLLEDLADALYPPKDSVFENGKEINLDKKHYKNRLLQYIKENKKSQTFSDIVVSSLDKTWEELNSIYNSTQKGSHQDLTKDEARRYLIHVYMLASDILNI